MPDRNSSREIDAIEARHMHPHGNLSVLDVGAALDEIIAYLDRLSPEERACVLWCDPELATA